jgi:hypothetical protein
MIGRERPHMGGLWQIGIEPRAGTAATPVFGRAGTYRVGAVATDEPTVLVGDHRSELNAHDAMRAADDQDCVGRQLALLHMSKGDWHAGFQTQRPVIR